MGWNAPGQNDPQDDGRRDQPSDPWGRTTRKQESDPLGALLKLLKDFFGGSKNGSKKQGSKKGSNTITLILVALLGIYIYSSIQKELKKLDQEFYYLTNNLIIDALIHLFSGLSEYEILLENYKQQFAKVMMEEKKKKKQITYKISKATMTKLERVNKQFDYLSKSDLVNFILLVLLDQLKIQNKKDQSNDQS